MNTQDKTPPVSIDKEVLESGNWFENEWRKLEQKGYNPAAMADLYNCLTALTNMCGIIPRDTFTEVGQKDFQAILNASVSALNNSKL
jgi:roadblock/LC7 domain-containing protein